MKKIVLTLVSFCFLFIFSTLSYAQIMYADQVTNLIRGDVTVGNYTDYYGGISSEINPENLTFAEALNAVIGAPDGEFLSLPGNNDTPSGTGFLYTYVEVKFADTFGADSDLIITEIEGNNESAHLWIWFLDGGNVQPVITRNGDDDIVVDLSSFASLVDQHGLFSKVGIGGLDTLGPSQGFDLDAVAVSTPVPTIDAILDFFDESVEAGTIVGNGSGNSANGRLNALRNMLEMAGDLINIGDIEGACGQLKAASKKCDGEKPPQFVTGSAVSILHGMIVELMEELGCE